MATKELQTRIALKYDTYANWTLDNEATQAAKTGANFVLLKGEIGICEIPSGNTNATTAPTVLFKVGDGTSPFKSLKWASALAADVHGWAKASDVKLTGKTITFTSGQDAEGKDIVIKSIPLAYVTNDEVTAITDPLAQRISAVEAKFSGDTSVEGQIDAVKGRLDTVEGAIETLNGDADTEGSVAKAVADSAAATKTAYEAYADKAAEDAVKEAVDAQATKDAEQDGLISDNATAIENEAKARDDADKLINAKFGAEYSAESTVAAAIADAKLAGTNAQAAADALNAENGPIKANAANIATNVENIAKNAQAIADEAATRAEEDGKLNTRLQKVEAFFEEAKDENGNYTGLTDTLDTLVEIQTFLSGEGSNVDQMLDTINEHGIAIEALEGTVGDANGGLVKDNTANKEAIAGLQGDVSDLQDVVDGYSEKGSIKTAVDAAQADAAQALTDAENAQKAADDARDGVDAINAVLTGDGKLVETVGQHTTDIAALQGTVGQHTTDIAGLTTATGNNTSAIEALQTLTGAEGDIQKAIAAAQSAAEDAQDAADAAQDTADGAAEQAETNKQDIAGIKANYVSTDGTSLMFGEDVIIFNCGNSEVE
jgi:hypothetical protein